VSGQLPVRRPNNVRALWLLAIGRSEAFALFGADSRAYLNSLAPLVALIIVVSALEALSGAPAKGAAVFLTSLTSLLAPPVIAEPLCRRWGCLHRWALFANILNWLQILMAPVLVVVLVGATLLSAAGVSVTVTALLMVLAAFTYITWLQWFTARGALGISKWQTVKLLFAIQLGVALLMVIQVETGTGSVMPPGLSDQLK
jgi:hypothetical protein